MGATGVIIVYISIWWIVLFSVIYHLVSNDYLNLRGYL